MKNSVIAIQMSAFVRTIDLMNKEEVTFAHEHASKRAKDVNEPNRDIYKDMRLLLGREKRRYA